MRIHYVNFILLIFNSERITSIVFASSVAKNFSLNFFEATEYFVATYHSEERQTDHHMRLDIQLLNAMGYTPSMIQLGKNYPNPFNPSTTISLSVDGDYSGIIAIYDIKGKEVRTLHDGKFQTGSSQFTWNGLNEYGYQISGGIYFCHLVLNGVHAQTIKMTFIK